MSTSYPEWSEAFKRLKQFKYPVASSIREIVDYYKTAMAKDDKVRRDAWFHALGYRKVSKDGQDHGEQKIERLLFNKKIELVREGKRSLPIKVSDQNFPLTKSAKGQVICDAFGFLQYKNKFHPLTIEVKVTANDVWFAVVESLIQVRLARYNLREIEDWALKHRLAGESVTKARGAWGLVIAPQVYFDEKKEILEAALQLTQSLRKIRAPIILASSDNLKEGRLRWVAGSYWPS